MLRAGAEPDRLQRRERRVSLGANLLAIKSGGQTSCRSLQHAIASEPDDDVVEAGEPVEHGCMLKRPAHAESDAPLNGHSVERHARYQHAATVGREEAGDDVE